MSDDKSEKKDPRAQVRAGATVMLGLCTGLGYIMLGIGGVLLDRSFGVTMTSYLTLILGLSLAGASILYRQRKATPYVTAIFLCGIGLILVSFDRDMTTSPESTSLSRVE